MIARFSTLAAIAAGISLVFAPGAFTAGQNPPGSCGVGSAVSAATQALGGIGQAAHDLGIPNVGNAVIEPFHDTIQATCHG